MKVVIARNAKGLLTLKNVSEVVEAPVKGQQTPPGATAAVLEQLLDVQAFNNRKVTIVAEPGATRVIRQAMLNEPLITTSTGPWGKGEATLYEVAQRVKAQSKALVVESAGFTVIRDTLASHSN